MVLYALSGTPGTGKTSVSKELRSRGYDVIDGKEFISEHGLRGSYDESRDTYEVDLELLNDALEMFRSSEGIHILDSHLSHFMDCRGAVILRCHPDVLADRLRARGYSEDKVRENVQAEILDEITFEAAECEFDTAEVDTSSCTASESADAVEKILNGGWRDYPSGKADWSSEMERWF